MKTKLSLLSIVFVSALFCACSSVNTPKAKPPLTGGQKLAQRQPPSTPLPGGVADPLPHEYPHTPRQRVAIPDPPAVETRRLTKQRVQTQSMYQQKAKAVETGILYPFEVEIVGENVHFCFDVPDDWTGWIIQKRGPEDDTWSEFGRSTKESTRGCRINSAKGFQYRLIRTISP